MATFNNLRDLENYVNSQQGQNAFLDEKQIRKVLNDAGRTLEKYLKEELQKYFNSYDPVEYVRTGDTLKSIKVGQPKKISINEWSLEITFDDGLANHPSVFGQEDGYTPWLLEVGWDISGKVGYSRPMFTEHKGTQYIKKAVNRFNKSNPHGLKVTVERNGERYI